MRTQHQPIAIGVVERHYVKSHRISTLVTNVFERHAPGTVYDVMQVTRLIIIAIFAVSGLGALMLSLRSLMGPNVPSSYGPRLPSASSRRR